MRQQRSELLDPASRVCSPASLCFNPPHARRLTFGVLRPRTRDTAFLPVTFRARTCPTRYADLAGEQQLDEPV